MLNKKKLHPDDIPSVMRKLTWVSSHELSHDSEDHIWFISSKGPFSWFQVCCFGFRVDDDGRVTSEHARLDVAYRPDRHNSDVQLETSLYSDRPEHRKYFEKVERLIEGVNKSRLSDYTPPTMSLVVFVLILLYLLYLLFN